MGDGTTLQDIVEASVFEAAIIPDLTDAEIARSIEAGRKLERVEPLQRMILAAMQKELDRRNAPAVKVHVDG